MSDPTVGPEGLPDDQPSEEMQEVLRSLSQPSEEMQEVLRSLSQPSEEMQEVLRSLSQPNEEMQEVLRSLSQPNEEMQEVLRSLSQPNEEMQEVLRSLSQPNEEMQEVLRSLSQPNEEMQEVLRSLSQPNEEMQEALRKLSEPSDEVSAALRALTRPSDKLVPEASFDGEDESTTDSIVAVEDVPSEIQRLQAVLEEADRSCSVDSRATRDGQIVELSFSLPAGRDERLVVVNTDGARALLDDEDLLSWRSLTHYNGIWNRETSVIEVELRGQRLGPSPRYLLRSLDSPAGGDRVSQLEVEEAASGRRLVLGEAGPTAGAILGGHRLGPPGRSLLTIRFEGHDISTTQEADSVIERFTDAFFFDLEVNRGFALVLRRLESHARPKRWRPERRNDPTYPTNQYPHPPLLLYRLGRDRSVPPVLRYWALYQVLEYFFPRYSHEDAMRRLQRHLRSPSFDPHRDEDIVKAIALAGRSTNSGEREDLTSTLENITSPSELRAAISQLELGDVLRKGGRDLSTELVAVGSDDVVRQLARRIYDVRCKIVHSKSSGANHDPGPGLLAGTAHDDLIQPELPLLEYLAQQAIVASAEPLR